MDLGVFAVGSFFWGFRGELNVNYRGELDSQLKIRVQQLKKSTCPGDVVSSWGPGGSAGGCL